MNEPLRTEDYRGYAIKVYYDECPSNPREWDNVATFVCEHRRYDLGDAHDVESAVDELFDKYVGTEETIKYFKEHRSNVRLIEDDGGRLYSYDVEWHDGSVHNLGINAIDGDDYAASVMADDFTISEKLELIEESGMVVIQQICMFEHSGISVWLGGTAGHPDARWDCGALGFAYVERETAEKEGATRAGYDDWKSWASARMEMEMEIYDSYVSGLVYGYRVENGEDDYEDSVWGYYGDDSVEGMIEEAKKDIDYHLERKAKQREENIQALSRSINSLIGTTFYDSQKLYKIGSDLFGDGSVLRADIKDGVVREYVPVSSNDLSDELLNTMTVQARKQDAA